MSEAKNRTILIVEDDMAMREIISHKLNEEGFLVKSAEDGEQGIEMVISEKPDLVLLDLLMPKVDGFGVLKAIRANPDAKLAKTPVIVLSNLWSSEEILKAKSFGVKDYLVKAYFTPKEILDKIKDTLSHPNTAEKSSDNPFSGMK